MSKTLSSAIAAYRHYRAAKAKSRAYPIARYLLVFIVVGFVMLLSFPQVLFAHETSYRDLKIYSREPLDQNIYAVLDRAEARLATSEINNAEVKPRIFLTNGFKLYSFLSLYIWGSSFGKGYPLLPTQNVFINKSDLAKDLVFRNAPANNQRSLSGVIAHETTHLLIRKRYGYWRNFTMPTWKKEGYAEYVAGGSTLAYETGVKMWKENPKDGTGYQYFKYYMLVKYLLEHDKLSVDDLFNRDFDLPTLEGKVYESL
ncbi:MAG: hypothetical protein ACRD9S_00515 [Pyrinomonadaceae bacterium]